MHDLYVRQRLRELLSSNRNFSTMSEGFLLGSFCKEEFDKHGLDSSIVQCNISYNNKKGTLRGMHYQVPPYEED